MCAYLTLLVGDKSNSGAVFCVYKTIKASPHCNDFIIKVEKMQRKVAENS